MKSESVLEEVDRCLLEACTLTSKPFPAYSANNRSTADHYLFRLSPGTTKGCRSLMRRGDEHYYLLVPCYFAPNFVEAHAGCVS